MLIFLLSVVYWYHILMRDENTACLTLFGREITFYFKYSYSSRPLMILDITRAILCDFMHVLMHFGI